MVAYAGIGSRETPGDVLVLMQDIAAFLGERGYVLRSGGAGGADTAFERGCDRVAGEKEIFIPWNGFSGRKQTEPGVYAGAGAAALALAREFHPAFDRCSQGAQKLHARNGYQVLGRRLDDPVRFVVCWTRGASGTGGTGQAIRIARANGIRVSDLGDMKHLQYWQHLVR